MEGSAIHEIFWEEFLSFAKCLAKYKQDATIYDVFILIRELNGNQPFSEGFIDRIDGEIERDEAKKLRKNAA